MSREVLALPTFSSSFSMNHVPRRLVSTAARLASVPSSTSTFPPKESFTVSKDALVKEEFNPETWAALQFPPSTALSAFAHRIGLASILTSTDLIQQVCTHSSFLTLYRHHHPTNPLPKSNAQLTTLGDSLMGLFATEYIHAKYPHLPSRVLKAVVTAHVGTTSCASVAQEMGASQLLRWHRITVCRFSFYKIIIISHTPHSLNHVHVSPLMTMLWLPYLGHSQGSFIKYCLFLQQDNSSMLIS